MAFLAPWRLNSIRIREERTGMARNIFLLLGACLISVILTLPCPTRAQTWWVAWERLSIEGVPTAGGPFGWKVAETLDPFPSLEECQEMGRKIINLSAERRLREGAVVILAPDGLAFSAQGLPRWEGDTWIFQFACWPAGVNPG